MKDEHSLMACSAIEHNAMLCFHAIAENASSPSVLYRPTLSIDGNQWCALYGEDLQSGVAGFGDSPGAAMSDFEKNWATPLPNSPGGIALAARVKP
ncbi:hypothetical protein AO392_14665 [Pseudomonas putida]|uniref:hypothetical protein n=1 Tax=Pseudomonas TaxID=286 RepID=UPI000731992C|nr:MULTISPECIES: hypothetical protein [Pseudomonas]KTC25464.1 hypothetical protein AO392_14665 [Pseudomonas putida]